MSDPKQSQVKTQDLPKKKRMKDINLYSWPRIINTKYRQVCFNNIVNLTFSNTSASEQICFNSIFPWKLQQLQQECSLSEAQCDTIHLDVLIIFFYQSTIDQHKTIWGAIEPDNRLIKTILIYLQIKLRISKHIASYNKWNQRLLFCLSNCRLANIKFSVNSVVSPFHKLTQFSRSQLLIKIFG
ncbi:unnamed protein product (macronuclear) [Paramecium tetraurelia]|uniref:Uncharacterized protein n=1 Tax=Paramecium tetraurelia TaxID=5888 RepID=A0C1U4_PARTE|nr:uncharacterized protein GSPATT00034238001 [Paramecium tetraurelia]CAK64761.1 unnamed protein product [Paramecium tetraurelia]|eukprot:XP_001432158.1 hypothetical protein (macronuclear) [Paramecium tetraurelia strain d4-2]